MKLVTSTGKEFEAEMPIVNPEPPRLYLTLKNVSPMEALEVFSDPEETTNLRFMETRFDGYETFQSLAMLADGIAITLKKGGNSIA